MVEATFDTYVRGKTWGSGGYSTGAAYFDLRGKKSAA